MRLDLKKNLKKSTTPYSIAKTDVNKELSYMPAGVEGSVIKVVNGNPTYNLLNKTDVGLNNVDNTSDLNKPISTATQSALDEKVRGSSSYTGSFGFLVSQKFFRNPAPPDYLASPFWVNQFVDGDNSNLQIALGINTKEPIIGAGTTTQYYRGDKTWQEVSTLPISTATQTALNLKENLLPLSYNQQRSYFVEDYGITGGGMNGEPPTEIRMKAWITATDLKSDLSIYDVDNTRDLDKPISSATQTALNLKLSVSAADSTYAKINTPTIGYFENVDLMNPEFYSGYNYVYNTGNGIFGKVLYKYVPGSGFLAARLDTVSENIIPESSTIDKLLQTQINSKLEISAAANYANLSSNNIFTGSNKFLNPIFTNNISSSSYSSITGVWSNTERNGIFSFRYNTPFGGNTVTWDSIRMDYNGQVGIGMNPTVAFEVLGTAKFNSTIQATGLSASNTVSALNLSCNAGANFAIASGNVGIGLGSPTSKLHVAGSGRITGALTLDNTVSGLLRVDASGNVTSDTSTYLSTSSASSTYLPLAGGTLTGSLLLNNSVKVGGTSNFGGNTFLGKSALNSWTNGSNNTALGDGALSTLTTANYNTAIGRGALETNNGSSNTAIGGNTMNSNTTGGYNVGIGISSLSNNTTGNYNVAVGSYAGQYNTGSGNTFLGGFNSTGYQTVNNSIFVSTGAGTLRFIVDSEGNFAIGTTTPNANSLFTVGGTDKASIPAPVMTQAQILAILPPVKGMQVYNNTINQMCHYNGTEWRKLTDTTM